MPPEVDNKPLPKSPPERDIPPQTEDDLTGAFHRQLHELQQPGKPTTTALAADKSAHPDDASGRGNTSSTRATPRLRRKPEPKVLH